MKKETGFMPPRTTDYINEYQEQERRDDEMAKPQPKKQTWIVYAFGAAFCFTLCNAAISEITSKVGPLCIFYFASGSILCGAVFHGMKSYQNHM